MYMHHNRFLQSKYKPCSVKQKLYEGCVTDFCVIRHKASFYKPLRQEQAQMRIKVSSTRGTYRFFSYNCVAKRSTSCKATNWRPNIPFLLHSKKQTFCSSDAIQLTSKNHNQGKRVVFAQQLRTYKTGSALFAVCKAIACAGSLQSKQQAKGLQSKYSNCKAIALQSKQSKQSKQQSKQLQTSKESANFSYAVPEIKLFVNLLMKHGKKTKALRILEVAALLFIKSISKTDLHLKSAKVAIARSYLATQAQKNKKAPYKALPCTKIGVFLQDKPSVDLPIKKSALNPLLHNNKQDHNYNQRICFARLELQSKRTLSFFPLYPSLNPVLQDFYIKRKIFANNPYIIGLQSNALKNVKSISNREKEDKKRLWYIHNRPEHWHQLSDVQKNTVLFALYTAISNVKPPLELRSKRVGGSNRQIPAAVSENRQRGYAIRWIIECASSDKAQTIQRKKRVQTANAIQGSSPATAYAHGTSLYDRAGKKGKNNNFVPLFCISLAESLKNAFYKKGPAFQKRNLWIENAQANRAFLRYRWW